MRVAQFYNIVDEPGALGKLLAATTQRVVDVLEGLAEAQRRTASTRFMEDRKTLECKDDQPHSASAHAAVDRHDLPASDCVPRHARPPVEPCKAILRMSGFRREARL